MKLHLNSDEINELLQSTTGDGPVETANPKRLEDARRHLNDCATCRMRMRAQENATESLALLKPTNPGEKGPICPPDYVWLDIAAGILDRDAENDLSHAAQCDHCGPLLRQAKEDFADELTPEEETMIADLPSSTTAWQGRLAAKLQDAQAPLPILSPPKDRSRSFLETLLAPWRLAFAAAVIGLILLGLRDYRRTSRSNNPEPPGNRGNSTPKAEHSSTKHTNRGVDRRIEKSQHSCDVTRTSANRQCADRFPAAGTRPDARNCRIEASHGSPRY